MTVDVRTRVDGPREPVEPDQLFATNLPACFERHRSLLAPAVATLQPRPLTVEVDGDAWTLTAAEGRVTIAAGPATGAARLRLDREQLADLVSDQKTPMAWLANGTLDLAGGGLATVLDWWLLLRGAFDGVAPHQPGAIALRDGSGDPLDLRRSFRPDDDPAAMARQLAAVGYLHVAGVFTPEEMAEVSADMDRIAPTHRPGDGRSWWATLADGREQVVRMQRFDEQSAVVAALAADDRLQRFGRLTGDGHQWGTQPDGNRIEALFKPLGVAQGISDIPWHKDCSLGRHSYDCCSVTAGISVTGADDVSGQLRVVAGSHRALMWPAPSIQPGVDLPVVDLATRTGDVTLHLSCTLHMAQAPTERERRVMYTTFTLPIAEGAAEAAVAARHRIRAVREAAPTTVSQPGEPAAKPAAEATTA
ncbi:MAG: hypothetical protein JWM05_1418 [Acidimicrobiales bacterium]|nr:hypothetical protein [Acidimicrobiales bacterium]